MMIFRSTFGLFFCLLGVLSVYSQRNDYYTFGNQFTLNAQHDTIGSPNHFSIYPAIHNGEWHSNLGLDHVRLGLKSKDQHKHKWGIHAYPILTQTVGVQGADEDKIFHQTELGIGIKVKHGTRFYAEWNVANAYHKLLSSEKRYTDNIGVLSGIGAVGSKNQNLYQSSFNTGYIQYSPSKHFALQIGRGKHFWGEGYRSVVWSDVSAPFNYFRINTTFWKVKYTNLFTQLDFYSDRSTSNPIKSRKYTTSHLFSINLTKRINIGVFETIVWNNGDSLTKRSIEPHYLNPIIFYRPVEFSLGSSDNALLGMLGSYRISNRVKLYGQILLDEFLLKEIRANRGWWGNKYALQGGLKCYNLFKKEGLGLVLEGNITRPFTYAHIRRDQNYANLGEPIANPLGSNYAEGILILNHSKDRLYSELKVTVAKKGLDLIDTIAQGGDLNQSNENRVREFNNDYFQGDETNLLTVQATCSYLIGHQNNLSLFLEAGYYKASSNFGKDLSNGWIELGIRTALFSKYRDALFYK